MMTTKLSRQHLMTDWLVARDEYPDIREAPEANDAQIKPSAFIAAIAAASVAACGGGSGGMTTANPATAPYQPLLNQAEPAARTTATEPFFAAVQSLPTPDQLMDWAERSYPALFPEHQANQLSDGIVYRFYPKSGNYLGVLGSDVLVLGPMSGNVLTRVGTLAQFAESIAAASAASDTEAARFLLQAQFSASDAEIAAVRSVSYASWLDQQFNTPASLTGWDALMGKGYNDIAFANSTAPADYMVWHQLIASPDAVRKIISKNF